MAGAMRRWWWVMNTPYSEEIALMKGMQQERCCARKRHAPGGGSRRRSRQRCGVQQDGDWQEVLAALPADLAEMARAEGAFCRCRQVRSAADLLRLVCVYALGDLSLRLTAGWATVVGLAELSDVALLGRLRQCLPWLQALVTAQLAPRRADQPAAEPATGRRLRLIDGSQVSGPGSAGTDWRLHFSYDPVAQRLAAIEVTDTHGGESLSRYAFTPEDIAVADRGYCRATGIAHVLDQQADVVVRLNTGALPLYPAPNADVALDLGAWLMTVPETAAAERPVWIDRTPGGGQRATADPTAPRLALRVVAHRLAPQAAAAARRRLHHQTRKHGRTPTQLSLDAAGFVLLLTSLDAAAWSATAVLALYRFRWQIELQIKRLKGLLVLDHLRTKDDTLAQVCLLARLLLALVIDRWTQPQRPTLDAWANDADRPSSRWRCTAVWLAPLRQALLGSLSLAAWLAALPRLRRFLCDSPRCRPSQAHAARTFQRLTQATNHAAA